MSLARRMLVSLTVLGLVCGLTTHVFAGTSQDELATLKKQVATLNDKISALESKQDVATSPALEKRVRELEARMTERAADDAPFTAGWKDGFKIQSSDGQHVLQIGGYLNADGTWQAGDPGYRDTSNDGFSARRIRLILCGYVYKYFAFKFEYAWDYGSTSLRDAYMDITYFDPVNLRIGYFKAPVSHEDLQDSSNLQFMERSLLNNFVPDRDTGVMLHGIFLKQMIEYQLAVLNGQDVGGVNGDDELAYFVRVMITPLAQSKNKWINKLSFGGNFSWGNKETTSLQNTTYTTTSGAAIFNWVGGAALHNDKMTYGAELMWYAGPLSLNAEWLRLEQEVGSAAAGLSPRRFQAEAWYVQVGGVLTGEDASYEGIKPKNNFDPRNGKWGAFELVLRYAYLNIEDEAIHDGYATGSDTADAVAIGLNWIMNPAVRAMIMYEHVWLNKDDTVPGYRNARDEDVIMFRFQLKF